MKLLSQEMVDEALKLAEDPEIMEKFKGLTMSIIVVCTDCPGNEDRQLMVTFADGKLADLHVEVQPAPGDMRTTPLDKAKFDAKETMPYRVFSDMLQKKMDLVAAFPHMKFEGDLPKFLPQVEKFVALIELIGTLPMEY